MVLSFEWLVVLGIGAFIHCFDYSLHLLLRFLYVKYGKMYGEILDEIDKIDKIELYINGIRFSFVGYIGDLIIIIAIYKFLFN